MTTDQFDALLELMEDLIKTQMIQISLLSKDCSYVSKTITNKIKELDKKHISK